MEGRDIKSIERVSHCGENRSFARGSVNRYDWADDYWIGVARWPFVADESLGRGRGEFNRIRFNARNHGGGEGSFSIVVPDLEQGEVARCLIKVI